MKSVIDIEKDAGCKTECDLITVVNSLKASKQMKAFGEFFNNQIEFATTVILSRTQNATPEQLEFCVKQIQNLNPKAAVITTDWDKISGEQILKAMEGQDTLEMELLAEERHAKEAEEHEHEHHHHDHDHEEHEHHHDHDHEEHEHHHDHDHEEHDHHDHDHEEHEHHVMTTKSMTIITSMTRTAPAAAMTMITNIITIIMQMRYLQAGARKHRISLRESLSLKNALKKFCGHRRVRRYPCVRRVW